MDLSTRRGNHMGVIPFLAGCLMASLLALMTLTAQADDQTVKDKDAKRDSVTKSDSGKDHGDKDQRDRDQKRADKDAQDKHPLAKGKLEESFAHLLIMANENEIRACQIAQERASSPEVKQFAQMMEQQHKEFVDKLKPYGDKSSERTARKEERIERRAAYRLGGKDKDQADKKDADHKDKDGNAAKDEKNSEIQQTSATEEKADHKDADHQDKADKSADDHDGFGFHRQMRQIHHELAAQCRETTEKELMSKTGAEFDNCFVGMQIAAHFHMADTLKVFERHSSGEFKDLLASALQTTESHLEQAKSLMKTRANAPAAAEVK